MKYLERHFAGESRLHVHRGDVLETDLAQWGPAAIAGNLPYYITSPILMRLAENAAVLDRAVLMVQREVADRVTATPGSRDFGFLSVAVQLHGPVEPLFTLQPGAFSPPPQVHSTVFRWRFAPRFEELGVDRGYFLAFLRRVFALKRKTLANNLRAAGMDSETIAAALADSGIDAKARAEALPIETLAGLWRTLQKREPFRPAKWLL